MCNCQKPHRWPLMVRLGSGTAVRPDSKLPQLTPRLLRWLKIFDSSMIDWRPSVRDQIPRYMWRKARLRKKGKKGKIMENIYFEKRVFEDPLAKPSWMKPQHVKTCWDSHFARELQRFWPFVKTWSNSFRASGDSWPYDYWPPCTK